MTQRPPTRVRMAPESSEGDAGGGTSQSRGEARQTRHDASTAAATRAGGRLSRRPSSPTRRRDGACAPPTARPVATPTAHAHAPTRGGRWPKRHAGGAANESAASGALASDPCGTPKNEGAATRRRAQKSGLGWSRSTCLQTCSLSHYIHCPGGSCGSTPTWLGVTARGSPRCCQPENATSLILYELECILY